MLFIYIFKAVINASESVQQPNHIAHSCNVWTLDLAVLSHLLTKLISY